MKNSAKAAALLLKSWVIDHMKVIPLPKVSSLYLSIVNKLLTFKGRHSQFFPHLPGLILELGCDVEGHICTFAGVHMSRKIHSSAALWLLLGYHM